MWRPWRAALFTDSSLEAYDRQQWQVFLLHAGTALEHLLKARLAEFNPALIAKRDHHLSLVWFADEAKHDTMASVEMRTIGLDEALVLAAAVGVPLSPYRDQLGVIQRHRNGVAHLGAVDEKVAHEVLPTVLQAFTLLVADLGVEPASLFGRNNAFVLSQLEQNQEREAQILEGRLARARMRFAEEQGELSPEALQHLRELAEWKLRRSSVDEQLVDCPACNLPAHANGRLEVIDWDVDYDKYGDPEGAYPVLEYRRAEVRCPTCGLVLDTPGLITSSGIFDSWELPDDDYDEWLRDERENSRVWDYDDI